METASMETDDKDFLSTSIESSLSLLYEALIKMNALEYLLCQSNYSGGGSPTDHKSPGNNPLKPTGPQMMTNPWKSALTSPPDEPVLFNKTIVQGPIVTDPLDESVANPPHGYNFIAEPMHNLDILNDDLIPVPIVKAVKTPSLTPGFKWKFADDMHKISLSMLPPDATSQSVTKLLTSAEITPESIVDIMVHNKGNHSTAVVSFDSKDEQEKILQYNQQLRDSSHNVIVRPYKTRDDVRFVCGQLKEQLNVSTNSDTNSQPSKKNKSNKKKRKLSN